MKKILALLLVIATNVYSQNLSQKELNGTWKVKEMINMNNSTFINFSEYLKFINNEIHFFKMESGKEIEKSIKKIVFINYPIKNIEPEHGGQLIKFENGEIWELWLRDINNEIRLIWNLKMDKDGNHLIQIDDRRMKKDREAQKKALEGEINTYYIKIK